MHEEPQDAVDDFATELAEFIKSKEIHLPIAIAAMGKLFSMVSSGVVDEETFHKMLEKMQIFYGEYKKILPDFSKLGSPTQD
jgi:hypothetical protein